jgi:hypothetical protein
MAKPAAVARRELNELRQRLQHLQQHYLQLQSSDELRDAIRESGYTIARAIRSNAVPLSALVLLPIDEVLDATLQMYTDWALSNTDANGRQRTYDSADMDAGFAIDGGRARNGMWELWFYIVERGSDHQRLIYTEGEVDKWLSKTDSIWANTPKMVWASTEYRKQGVQFSLFCAELLARIDAVTSQSSSSSISEPTTKKFTPGELVDELDKLLTKASQYYTAEQVWQHLLENNPGKTIGLTAIKNHPKWKEHNREWGQNRAARNTSRQAEKSELGKLIAEQKRREQQTRYRGVDRIADGD